MTRGAIGHQLSEPTGSPGQGLGSLPVVTRRILLIVSLLAALALAVPVGPVGASPGSAAAPRDVAATESAPVGSAAPAGSLRESGITPDPGGSVSASAGWRIVTSPNRGRGDNHIHEVSCVNNTKCVGVGYNEDATSGYRQSIVAALISGAWKNQKIPQRGTASNTLWNVSCVAGNRCWAVGYYADVTAGYYRTLIASYARGYWSLVNSPNKSNTDNYLFGVDCVDASHCVAVGRYYFAPSGVFRTLVLSLTGTDWKIMSSPNRSTSTNNNFLADISCGDATHCMAAGYSLSAGGVYSTLMLERNDNTWRLRSTKNVTGASNVFRDVSCPTVTDCVAVGGTDPGTPNEQTLIERYAAGTWTIEPSPNRASTDNHLWGVSCPDAANCVAVGQSQNSTRSWTLVATYAAGVWTQTPSPSRGGTFNFQYGLSCPNISHCVSSGDYINIGSTHYRSLILTNS